MGRRIGAILAVMLLAGALGGRVVSIRGDAAPPLRIGLITDQGGVNDKSFHQSAWAGLERARVELGVQTGFLESLQPTEYDRKIDAMVAEGYNAVVTVGYLFGDATARKAKEYPTMHFAIVDYAYPSGPGGEDTYRTGLKNVTSLMFRDDQIGFLAGVVAAGISKSGTVCSVAGMDIAPVQQNVTGYQNGAHWMNPGVKTLNVYVQSFTDAAKGKAAGLSMIGLGCDVVYGVGGGTGNGGLLAAKEKGLPAIGVDLDQYLSYPEVRDALVTSAMKNIDVAVYAYVKALAAGQAPAGIMLADLANDGVGLASYHDWDGKVPQAVKDRVAEAIRGLKDGRVHTGAEAIPGSATPAATTPADGN
jgi:basic membrane protein A and related proteins